jgi:hypothetical protein
VLHITNGDVAVERMREGGLPGTFLPWRDALHDGPVPMTDSLEELSAMRARFLAACGFGEEAFITKEFTERDAMLARYCDYGEIVFWFEHDLYDQLQLLQLLDWLACRPRWAPVSLIVIGSYPGIDRFVGLGQLSPQQLVGLVDSRIPAMPDHFRAAMDAWLAFRQPDPRALFRLLEVDVPTLPYLREAVLRLLEELPAVGNGLSRTERAALDALGRGVARPAEIFGEVQFLEQRPWLGDWGFWRILGGLAQGSEPLVETESGEVFRYPPALGDVDAFRAQRLVLTHAGNEVLHNRRDAVTLRGIDRWLGGTHLTNASAWRWNDERQELIAP